MCKYCENVNNARKINDLKFYRGIFSSNTQSFIFKNITFTKMFLVGYNGNDFQS